MKSEKSVLPSASSRLIGANGTVNVSRPAPAVIVIALGGKSVDDLADALSFEMETDMVIQGAIQLFIDARGSVGASMMLSHRWGRWFRDHQAHLERVVLLTGAGFVKITGEFVRTFAGLENRMEIILVPEAFERIKLTAIGVHQVSGTFPKTEAPSDN